MHLICGINPVLEALNAGNRTFDRLLVAKGDPIAQDTVVPRISAGE